MNFPTSNPSVVVNGRIMCDQVVLLLVYIVLLLQLMVSKTYPLFVTQCLMSHNYWQTSLVVTTMLKQLLLLNYGIYSFHISPTNMNAINMAIQSLENLIYFNLYWSVSCHSCQCARHECTQRVEIKLNTSLTSPPTCH